MATKPSTRNVLKVMRQADADAKAAGRSWYAIAHEIAVELDPTDVERASAVLSVLSRQCRWNRNVKLAHEAYGAYRAGASKAGYLANNGTALKGNGRMVARLLWDRIEPAAAFGSDAQKTRAFWQLILTSGTADVVCIDRHAIDIAYARVHTNDTRPSVRGKRYAEIVKCYVRASAIYSHETGQAWTPTEIQAATWTFWRDTK